MAKGSGWGVYTLTGALVFDVDSVVDLKYSNKSKVSDFPVEKGAFATYNKVASPFGVKVQLAVSGSTRVSAFLAALDAEVGAANLYNVATPEAVYLNVTLESFDYARASEKGLGLVVAALSFQEVREVTPAYTTVALPPKKVKRPGSASKAVGGKVQAQSPPPPPPLTLANVWDRARSGT